MVDANKDNYMKYLLFLTTIAISLIISCAPATISSTQDEHTSPVDEPVAFELEVREEEFTGKRVTILSYIKEINVEPTGTVYVHAASSVPHETEGFQALIFEYSSSDWMFIDNILIDIDAEALRPAVLTDYQIAPEGSITERVFVDLTCNEFLAIANANLVRISLSQNHNQREFVLPEELKSRLSQFHHQYIVSQEQEEESTTPAAGSSRRCCRTCRRGKACGDSCIAANYNCTRPPGCACNAR